MGTLGTLAGTSLHLGSAALPEVFDHCCFSVDFVNNSVNSNTKVTYQMQQDVVRCMYTHLSNGCCLCAPGIGILAADC